MAPRNSILLVMDHAFGDVPESFDGKSVTPTSSCVVVGTFPEQDGETLISMSDDESSAPEGTPVFDGVLDTPGKQVSVCSALDQQLIDCQLLGVRTRVRIWANDVSTPDDIRIIVGPADEEKRSQ